MEDPATKARNKKKGRKPVIMKVPRKTEATGCRRHCMKVRIQPRKQKIAFNHRANNSERENSVTVMLSSVMGAENGGREGWWVVDCCPPVTRFNSC